MEKNLFYTLLESGQIKVTDEGLVTILGEYALFFPARVFLHWQEMLVEKMGPAGNKMMYEMGKYQVLEALKRYTKVLGIQSVDKSKILELTVKVISMIGHGTFEMEKCDISAGTAVFVNKKLPLAHAYLLTREKSAKPTDFYVAGLLAGLLAALCGKKVECIETECLAAGGKCCRFELSPDVNLKF